MRDRDAEGDRQEPVQSSAPAPAGPTPGGALVLEMQRTAGNAAVARLLGPAGSSGHSVDQPSGGEAPPPRAEPTSPVPEIAEGPASCDGPLPESPPQAV